MKKYIGGIYIIRHIDSGREYIGSSYSFDKRKKEHYNLLNKNIHHNQYLQRLWNKYGESAFKFIEHEIVEDKTKLVEREQYWIDLRKPDINICLMANSTLGTIRTSEQKAKMSLAGQGKGENVPKSDEHKAAISKALQKAAKEGKLGHFKGKKQNPEWVEKRVAARRGRKLGPLSEETKQKLRISCSKPKSEKAKENIGNAIRNRYASGWTISEETREKLRLATLGRVVSSETKQKQKIARNAGNWKMTPEGQARVIAAHTGSKRSEETKEKMKQVQIKMAADRKEIYGSSWTPEQREKTLETRAKKIAAGEWGKPHSDDTKAVLSLKRKEWWAKYYKIAEANPGLTRKQITELVKLDSCGTQ